MVIFSPYTSVPSVQLPLLTTLGADLSRIRNISYVEVAETIETLLNQEYNLVDAALTNLELQNKFKDKYTKKLKYIFPTRSISSRTLSPGCSHKQNSTKLLQQLHLQKRYTISPQSLQQLQLKKQTDYGTLLKSSSIQHSLRDSGKFFV